MLWTWPLTPQKHLHPEIELLFIKLDIGYWISNKNIKLNAFPSAPLAAMHTTAGCPLKHQHSLIRCHAVPPPVHHVVGNGDVHPSKHLVCLATSVLLQMTGFVAGRPFTTSGVQWTLMQKQITKPVGHGHPVTTNTEISSWPVSADMVGGVPQSLNWAHFFASIRLFVCLALGCSVIVD